MTTANYDELIEAILRMHGAKATHLETAHVKETFKGKTVWEGDVEIFKLHGHVKTDKVYAWTHETDDPHKSKRHVAVLHIPPVVSPQTAVRAAIVQGFRDAEA